MKKCAALIFAVLLSVTVLLLSSCSDGKPEDTAETREAASAASISAPESSPMSESVREMNAIFDSFPEKLTLKDGRVYLYFGARVTLNVTNFNKLILEDQLGIEEGRYSFRIDKNVLDAMKQDDTYGGIGYGQEWIAVIPMVLEDLKTGERTDVREIVFTFHKDTGMDKILVSDPE